MAERNKPLLATQVVDLAEQHSRIGQDMPSMREPESITQLRAQSLTNFKSQGFPTRHHEDWKYTPIDRHMANPAPINQDKSTLTPDTLGQLNCLSKLDCHLMVFINGMFDPALSELTNLPDGVVLTDLQTALADVPAVSAHLMGQHHHNKPSDHSFTMMNTAFMHTGVCLVVPASIIIEKPIHVVYLSNQDHSAHIRNVFLLEKGSQATLVEQYGATLEPTYFNNVVTDVVLDKKAHFSHYKLALENDQSIHVASIRATNAQQSEFNSYALTSGGKVVRSDTHALLQAPESIARFNGAFIAKRKQLIDHHTYVEHAAVNTQSEEHYKGVIGDSGHGVFNGRVMVNAGASGTDAKQENHNLLLSRDANIDTKPQLEIFNDDVKCTHGATVGQLDPDAVFYCQARGIDVAAAHLLLTSAFAQTAFDNADNDTLSAAFSNIVERIIACS